MIELWIKPSGLRRGHDPKSPKQYDVRFTPELLSIPHRTILESEAVVLVKDRYFERRLPLPYEDVKDELEPMLRVTFDPDNVGMQFSHSLEGMTEEDNLRIADMRNAVQHALLVRRER